MDDNSTSADIPEYSGKWWMKEITTVEKHFKKEWWDDADDAVRRYLDIRGQKASGVDDTQSRKYNVFWANVQIIKAALYATPPKPAIKRQHDDSKDDVARTAALILERIINFGLDRDMSDMHSAFDKATEGLLIPGMGQAWLRYVSEVEKFIKDGVEGEKITYEDVETDHVNWRDFLYSISRTWQEVWWVGRRVWMKRKQFQKRFGEEKYKQIKDQCERETPNEDGVTPRGFKNGRVEVFEVWCEDTNKVYWVNRHVDDVLAEKDDPAQLDGFFPCPEPLLATHTSDNLIPRTDYRMVQDQYEELDTLNSRIATLTRALRVVGVYDDSQTELKQLLTGAEFNMVAVSNWDMYAEKGGMKNVIDWFPVDTIAKVLLELTEQRVQLVAQIYELTSISDIMRGASNPRDTLGAQKLKAQYSSVRLQLRQQDIGKFVRACIRIKCELICKHWSPATIKEVSQIQFTESAKFADEAIKLLKNYRQTQYRIEVGEESLSLADYNAERELRTEYLTAFGQYLSQAAVMLEAYPAALPYVLRMVQWVTAAFRGSSDVETILDEAIAQAETNPPQQGDNGQAEAMAKTQIAQMEAQKDEKIETAKLQVEHMKAAAESQLAMAKLASEERIAAEDRASKERMNTDNNQTKVLIEQIKAGQVDKELAAEALNTRIELFGEEEQRNHESKENALSREASAEEGALSREAQAEQAEAQREADAKLNERKGNADV